MVLYIDGKILINEQIFYLIIFGCQFNLFIKAQQDVEAVLKYSSTRPYQLIIRENKLIRKSAHPTDKCDFGPNY